MSFNNVQSLNGVIKPHRIVNVNSNISSNPNSQLDYYNQQINSIETDGYKPSSSNVDKTSLELALNILGIEHNIFEGMSKHEFMHYYDNFKKQNSNLNRSLAAQIALKYKLNNVVEVNSGLFQKNNNLQTNNNFYQPENYHNQNINNYFVQPTNNNLKNQSNVFQYQVQSQENDKNSNTNKTFLQQTNNNIKKITPNYESMELKSNFKPVQVGLSDTNKYLISSNTPPVIDQYSRDFDLNSIINNYSNQKNIGVKKNIDISFNIPRRN